MTPLILQLFQIFGPIVADIIRKRQAAGGAMPSDAEITAEFQANIQTYLDEGSAWSAAHPRPPQP